MTVKDGMAGAAIWTDEDMIIGIGGSHTAGVGINVTNNYEIYGFHSGGANVAMADGSVRFLKDSLKLSLQAAYVTMACGEITND